jgi:hypothetical protein
MLGDIHQYMRHSQSAEDEQRRINNLVEALNKSRDDFQIGRLLTPNDHQSEGGTSFTEPIRLALAPPTSKNDSSTGFEVSSGLNVSNSVSKPDSYYNSVFKLDINRFRKGACRAFCSCVCHRRQRRTKRGMLGRLTLGYSSLPFLAPKCSEETCANRTKFSATITYHFPSWFFLRVISLIFVTSVFGDPFIGIEIRPMTQVISLFKYSSVGDIERIKRLFKQGEAHPSSSFLGGWTALHVCEIYRACYLSYIWMIQLTPTDFGSTQYQMPKPQFAGYFSTKKQIIDRRRRKQSICTRVGMVQKY